MIHNTVISQYSNTVIINILQGNQTVIYQDIEVNEEHIMPVKSVGMAPFTNAPTVTCHCPHALSQKLAEFQTWKTAQFCRTSFSV